MKDQDEAEGHTPGTRRDLHRSDSFCSFVYAAPGTRVASNHWDLRPTELMLPTGLYAFMFFITFHNHNTFMGQVFYPYLLEEASKAL